MAADGKMIHCNGFLPASRLSVFCLIGSLAAVLLGCSDKPTKESSKNSLEESIFGVLSLEGGRAAAGAIVYLHDQADFAAKTAKKTIPIPKPDSAFFETTSDDSGHFNFAGVPKGRTC